jgi:hypothetical protein
LGDELAAKVMAEARNLIEPGFLSKYGAAQLLVDAFSESGGRLPIVHNQAMRTIAQAWHERLDEQAGWPERTAPAALEEAFESLERHGIVARANYFCCGNCGHTAIRDEAEPESIGYVFFHQQSTEGAIENGHLYLQYGAYGPDREQDTSIGQQIADAVTAAGLPHRWAGTRESAVVVGPISWLKRLPASTV